MARQGTSVKKAFEQAVERHGGAVALVCGAERLTYAELDRQANQWAHVLLEQGVGPGEFVGVMADRSPEMVIALLAIVKAGGAYLPLALNGQPAELETMCSDAQLRWVLVQASLQGRTALHLPAGTGAISLDAKQAVPQGNPAAPDLDPSPLGPIYAMFTSGSTGRPKGVVAPHQGVVRLVFDTSYLHFGPENVFLQLSPIDFDASTLEIWGSLLHGGRLVLMPPGTPTLDSIAETIRSSGVNTMFLTTALFHLAVDQRAEMFAGVQQLVFGGDVADPQRVARLAQMHPHLRLVNGYGPTENTTFTTCYVVPRGYQPSERLPIGWPLEGTRVYVVDGDLRPVPDGERGQLVTSGEGLSLGYLNNPEATAERFVPDPFSHDGGRLYLTGDQACRLPDGSYDFFGRLDNQVKISGHRVELDAVEAALRSHPSVREAAVVVVAGEGTEKKTVAFVELRAGVRESVAGLRDHLQGRLPVYAMPSRTEILAALPMTASGKLDRKRLATMATGTRVPSAPAPQADSHAAQVRRIWQRTLQRQSVGMDDNFFDLGATSLDLIAVHAELVRTVQPRLRITDLFACPTPRTLARFLDRGNTPAQPAPSLATAARAVATGHQGRD
jgi:amino acid adenylation domain-containing protein